ncbi:hypothetical protein SARI_00597 [Salmonella enterica subsp. arizonae serovar 62:z4,z23:-]|uniref:Uncharacterized protein n=1 Tax=Salmonella arizonae (strain ATCC BAA-731 / CDC346-86 / RSK2980) TaxID=41514 RepID=A9MJC4_SALAR|nr:hypothetical protein SARI_00597 [Salmonella enterica subsp. arizonae serovar 62:z4,z23:-]
MAASARRQWPCRVLLTELTADAEQPGEHQSYADQLG